MIRQCVPIPQKIYPITKRLKTPEEVEQYFPGFMAFIDSTEQQIPRPVDKNRRKMYYSGKKKRHTTVKNQFMVNNRGYILHKATHMKGRIHDYDVYKNNHPVTPPQVVNVVNIRIPWSRKGFSRTTIRLTIQKEKKPTRIVTRRKRVQ